MKKFLFIAAAAAALLTACQVKEELAQDSKVAVADEGIKFDVYTQRDVNTKGGIAGTNDNTNIGERGFGVFAYYTNGEKYDQNAKPNFMYNQQVTKPGDKWVYEPVKYWPNEYGSAAQADEIDYVTFFAYAPYVEFEPTTGAVSSNGIAAADLENWQKYNIVSVNKNSATGDPIIKYVVDTDPKTSVDLLWGVAAQDATSKYSAITGDANVTVTPGKPFIDLVKPADPKNDKLNFNLRHSLAKVKFTIDYIADDFTPDGPGVEIDSTKTRIFVRSFTMDGWALQGALNLNNEVANKPNWKDIDGIKELTFDALEFNDGRKDGKEGTANGAQSNEKNADRLNPVLVENHAEKVAINKKFNNNDVTPKEDYGKNHGVYPKAKATSLFKASKDGYFYVIPRDNKEPVNMTIVYDVETIDKNLANFLSDGATNGISIENKITKEAVLGANTDIEAGKQYLFIIHLGMTSVKVEAIVSDWYEEQNTIVDLPDNQPKTTYWTVEGVPGVFTTNPAEGVVVPAQFVTDEASYVDALTNGGPWQNYYKVCDFGNNGDGKYTRYTEWADYQLAAADRFNATLNQGSPDNVIHTPAEWEAAGYYRCWKGVLAHTPNQWPQIAIDLNANVLPNGTANTCKIYYKNAEVSAEGFDGTWVKNKLDNKEPYVIWAAKDLGCTGYYQADGTMTEDTFKKDDFVVKFFYDPDKVTEHTK